MTRRIERVSKTAVELVQEFRKRSNWHGRIVRSQVRPTRTAQIGQQSIMKGRSGVGPDGATRQTRDRGHGNRTGVFRLRRCPRQAQDSITLPIRQCLGRDQVDAIIVKHTGRRGPAERWRMPQPARDWTTTASVARWERDTMTASNAAIARMPDTPRERSCLQQLPQNSRRAGVRGHRRV